MTDQPQDNALYLREWARDIRMHNGRSVDADRLESIADELGRVRIALASIVDRDFTYQGEHVAGGQILREHIYQGRKALNAKHLEV